MLYYYGWQNLYDYLVDLSAKLKKKALSKYTNSQHE